MASIAEERIRAVAEQALRWKFPDARIIHELVLVQGHCRIDLAAVTGTRIVTVEIKSERDVLDRLRKQFDLARAASDLAIVVTADKHLDKVREQVGWLHAIAEAEVSAALDRADREIFGAATNAPARLEMLWASELRRVSGKGTRFSRRACIAHAADAMTGAEVRMRVCDALRAREFARADPPMLSDAFPEVTRFER